MDRVRRRAWVGALVLVGAAACDEGATPSFVAAVDRHVGGSAFAIP
jgi:hypothetical protein